MTPTTITLTQEVAVTLTSVIVVPVTAISTVTHEICTGVITTGIVGGVTGPGGSSGGGSVSSTVGGGGGGGSSSTCVWGAPVTTGGYGINFLPVEAGVSNLGVSSGFEWSFWMSRTVSFYLFVHSLLFPD